MHLFYPEGYDAEKLEMATSFLINKYQEGYSLSVSDILDECIKALETVIRRHDKSKATFETYYRKQANWNITKLIHKNNLVKHNHQSISLDVVGEFVGFAPDDFKEFDAKEVLERAKLTEIEYDILYEYCFKGTRFSDIAKKHGFTRQYISILKGRAAAKVRLVIDK
jgi:DNA-directed RNA polymerase specialized sigma subunit